MQIVLLEQFPVSIRSVWLQCCPSGDIFRPCELDLDSEVFDAVDGEHHPAVLALSMSA